MHLVLPVQANRPHHVPLRPAAVTLCNSNTSKTYTARVAGHDERKYSPYSSSDTTSPSQNRTSNTSLSPRRHSSLFSPPQSHVTAGSRPCTVCRKPARRAGCVQGQAARGNVKSSDLHPHHRQHCCNSQTRLRQAVTQHFEKKYSAGGVTAPLISSTTKPRGEVPAMHCTQAGGGVNVAVNAVYP